MATKFLRKLTKYRVMCKNCGVETRSITVRKIPFSFYAYWITQILMEETRRIDHLHPTCTKFGYGILLSETLESHPIGNKL